MTATAFHALVTGTSSGIGEEVAKRMLAKGWRVVGLARSKPAWTHDLFEAIEVDLLDEGATRDAAAELATRPAFTHAVHNAGLVWPNLVGDVKPEEVAGLTMLHVTAPLMLTQAILPKMREARFGRIVFVTSRAAMGVPTRTAYAATKAGVHGMARTWALELGPEGITVNVVAPGPILTGNFWGIVPKGSEREAAIAGQLPVRRLGTVADVAHAVEFFAAEESGFVTGQVLFVCGGGSIGGLSL
ncbi:SDR family NAD(P)-dependent oxidoreductase [Arenibaculum sp.]|jgi:NAD(P)-dependent dehydrogenase (short-subunit alcohol dehydrogenase family)|uniref:SDR family NAD(P)-dependent oxidoreductase n=1 Tax=Arenibaculum sp. TaxID=2865862 RepID=UPI002E12DB51|nr:SDR family oxidoreductase [Arenibaculum sp.]